MSVYDIPEKIDHKETHAKEVNYSLYTVAIFENSIWTRNFAVDSGDPTF